MNLSVKPIYVQRLSTGNITWWQLPGGSYLVADPELDSDFFGADFSVAGFAGAVVEEPESDLVVEEVDEPESDLGAFVEAELSEARESVR